MLPGRPSRLALLGLLAICAMAMPAAAKPKIHPRSNVGFDVAVLDAMVVAMQKPGRSVVRMDGDSMLPFFGADSIAVVQQIPAARLRLGMIAVYTNFLGEKVAHRVIAKAQDGWTVQGYNNPRADSTVVNETNLLGVVYATFSTAGAPKSAASAGFAMLPTMDVVLGAPAK
ncbi:MAG TPA: S24/S26 family peptidase [Opitutaceae bacterium]|nr:S24/S26 family peptidase [Opitutaceae bacterium]